MHPYVAVPATLMLVWRAWSRKSLTPLGIVTATLTAVVHAIHPWSIFFALLVVFFLGGTTATKVKHDVKAHLTQSSSGGSGGEGARTHVQVLANSVVASVLILAHYLQLRARESSGSASQQCWPYGGDLLVVGIVSNYAAVAADTFSSELGILSKSKPRLITSFNLRQVPPGTNGGVTLTGIAAGFLGAFTIALTSVILLPFCSSSSSTNGWGWREKTLWVAAVTVWGDLGSLLDSFLGGWLQASVVEVRTGKVVEGDGGRKVLVHGHAKKDGPKSRKVESGMGLLDNNDVNLLMAVMMSIGGMIVASYVWNQPLRSIVS